MRFLSLAFYQEGKKPKPQKIEIEQELSELSEHWKNGPVQRNEEILIWILSKKLKLFLQRRIICFLKLMVLKNCLSNLLNPVRENSDNEYYDKNGTELRLQFQWYPKIAETGGLLITLQEDGKFDNSSF